MKTNRNRNSSSPLSVTLPLEDYQALLDQVDSLNKKLEYSSVLQELLSSEQQENTRLRYEVARLERLCWGRSSEKRRLPEDPAQLKICFDEPNGVDPVVVEAKKEEELKGERKYNRFRKSFKTKPQPHSRQPIPAHIPRETRVVKPEVDLIGAVQIGEEVSEQYAIHPRTLYVQRIVRPRYKLADGRIAIAPLPDRAHPQSNASAGVLAHIAVSKYADHLPLHRQIEIFTRQGVRLPASTVSNWMMAAAERIEPVYNELRELMKKSDYVQADETPHPVLESNRPGKLHTGYMWAFYLPHCKSPYFEYHPGRGSSGLGTLLSGQTRIVQSDGYVVYKMYDELPNKLHLCCWAHVRRKFVEAESQDPPRARYVLDEIKKLYAVESEIKKKGLEKEEAVALRRETAYPVIKGLGEWVKENRADVLTGSPLDKAICYMDDRFEQLSHYINDAELAIDNNAVERTIRPLTLNRKNCLFSGSHDAAHAAAIFFSLLGACRENRVNPNQWLEDCLLHVNQCDPKDYSSLLPHYWKNRHTQEETTDK